MQQFRKVRPFWVLPRNKQSLLRMLRHRLPQVQRPQRSLLLQKVEDEEEEAEEVEAEELRYYPRVPR